MPDSAARHEYVFGAHEHDPERKRLIALEEVHDPTTQRLLLRAGLGPGQTCAEIGAGEGSIARYMAKSVGPRGRVVAVDIDTRFLATSSTARLEVRRADITKDPLEPASFDLIHGRFVLLHVKDLGAALANLWQALKPGGVLLLEEPDFRTALPASRDMEQNDSMAKVNAAVLSMYSSMGIDPALGSRLPSLMADIGCEEVELSTHVPLAPGGSAIAKMMAMSITHLRSRLVASGAASDVDVEAYAAAAHDTRVRSMYYATVAAWGRKPSTPPVFATVLKPNP